MSLTDREIIDKFSLKKGNRILEVGGSMKQHQDIQIDVLVDIIRPEESFYTPSTLKAKRFVRLDVTREKLPFKDKEFDFCLCTHTLEDLLTPFLIIEEMSRVAKRGYMTTPSMGRDIVFGPIDLTNYRCGPIRVPGLGHHKWLFQNKNGIMKIIPKNYALLYSALFQFVGWDGEEEMQYYWEKEIKIEAIDDLNVHNLIKEYCQFVNDNRRFLKKGTAALFPDNPVHYLKEVAKLLFRRGAGFKYLP